MKQFLVKCLWSVAFLSGATAGLWIVFGINLSYREVRWAIGIYLLSTALIFVYQLPRPSGKSGIFHVE